MAKLVELVLSATYNAQQIINRWNYLVTGTPSDPTVAAAIIQAFGCIWDGSAYPSGLPFKDILILQNPGVVYQFATARNVYDDLDFAEVPFVNPAVGTNGAGQNMSSFLAYGLRTNRTRIDVGRGYKRFVGCNEGDVTPFGAIDISPGTAIAAVAEALSATLSVTLAGNDYSCAPVIAGKQRYNPDTGLADPAGSAYRYYPVEADQMAKLSTGIVWEAYDHVRSQVSRQVGHGR